MVNTSNELVEKLLASRKALYMEPELEEETESKPKKTKKSAPAATKKHKEKG